MGAWDLLNLINRELFLFAAAGFLIGGIDDVAVDILWFARGLVARVTGQHRPPLLARHAGLRGQKLALFVPAWQEADVIGPMLDHIRQAVSDPDVVIFVGCYLNDPDTQGIVASRQRLDARIRMVINRHAGPTTKADCLNALWQALLADELQTGWRASAVVLHDAEDIVHPDEPDLYRSQIGPYDFVQIPVLPIVVPGSPLVSGHYCDEFAEAHGKTLLVRALLGAAIPAAGVGCAFSRRFLALTAATNGGLPFRADSLTEDYELGLSVKLAGARGAFVRQISPDDGSLIAVRAYFPATIDAATRQKARWMAGIALAGWDRLGWAGSWADIWMIVRDRRAVFAAIVLASAYAVMLISALILALGLATGFPMPALTGTQEAMLLACQLLLLWRLGMRFVLVWRTYGLGQALLSIPRMVVANAIAILAARRALLLYLKQLRTGQAVWDKTDHLFPISTVAR